MKLIVKSLRVENFVEACYCDNIDTIKNRRYILNCVDDYRRKYEILLHTNNGDCGSGWCAASWGNIKIIRVKNFNGFTHALKQEFKDIDINIPDNINDYEYFECNVFTYCEYNGDEYYPNGYVTVNMDLFEPTPRYKGKRPVWIFKGDSALGKSYISSLAIRGNNDMLTKYETDSSDSLPKELYQDIIVIGNKYNYSIDDIEKLIIGDHETIIVDFSHK